MSINYLKTYLNNRPPHLAIIRSQEIPFYQKYLPFSSPLLDFGCGDGFFLKTLLYRQNEPKLILAIETNSQVIKQAKKTGLYKEIILAQKLPYPLKNGFFSIIIANCVFEHIAKLPPVIQELWRLLKPNGLLLTTVATSSFPQYLLFKSFFGYKKFFNTISRHRSLLKESDWIRLFQNNNFTIEEKRPYLFNPTLMKIFDISHWLGFPYLVSYKITGKWNGSFFQPYNAIWQKLINWALNKPKDSKEMENKSPYLFFALRKKLG